MIRYDALGHFVLHQGSDDTRGSSPAHPVRSEIPRPCGPEHPPQVLLLPGGPRIRPKHRRRGLQLRRPASAVLLWDLKPQEPWPVWDMYMPTCMSVDTDAHAPAYRYTCVHERRLFYYESL